MAKSRRKKKKLRARFEGRELIAKCKVEKLDGGQFVYKGNVYAIDDFPEGATIHLDKTGVAPLYRHNGSTKKKKRKRERRVKKNLSAWLYSNVEECPDVTHLL